MKTLRISAALALVAGLATAQQQPPKELPVETVALGRPADFAQDILPILKSKCLACHNAKDKEAELILESPAQMLKGGESGPALVPGKADDSLLLKTAAYRAKPYMPPPKNKIGAVPLTSRELGLLKLWINEGAKGSAVAAQLVPPPTLKATPAGWNPIYAVAVDPDAQYVACGRAGRLFLYHVPTQKLVDRPGDPALATIAPGLAHTDAVQAIAFSPDGRLLATGGYRSIKIWKKGLAEKKSTLELGGEPLLVALSSDGTKAAAAFADFAVRLFDVPSGKRIAEMKDHTAAVVSLRFSPDGATLLTASADKTARWYGATSGKIEAPDAISAADWAGGKVATGHPDGTIRIWTDKAAKELKGHKAVVVELRGTPAGLVSVSQDAKLKVWNLEKGEAGKDIAATGVTSLVASPDGKRWVTLGADGAKLWDAEGGKAIADLKTDGPARRHEQAAAALLAFAGAEVGYRQGQVKKEEDEKKKEDEEVKKAADAIAPAETAQKEKAEALAKAKAARETADKGLADAKAALDAAKAKAEGVAKALEAALSDEGLKKLEAEHAASTRGQEAAAKVVEDAQKRADAAAKTLADAKAATPAATPDKAGAEKALAEAQSAYDDAKAKAAAAAKALADAKDDDAKKKAGTDKKKADEAVVALRAKRNDARTKVEAATKTPASQPPSDSVKKAEAEKAAADAALAEAKKGSAAPAASKLLLAGRAAAALRKVEADKAVVDQAPAVSLAPLQAAVESAAKALADAKAKAAAALAKEKADAKAKADAAAKALAAAKDDAAKKKAEEDKKAADAALAKAEAAKPAVEPALEEAVAKAEAALANGQKAKDATKAKVDAAAADLAKAKTALETAKKDVDAEKAAAEAAVKAGEAPLKAAEKAQADAKKAEETAAQAAEQAKAGCESAKRRAEKAKEAAAASLKAIEAAQAALKAQQDEQKKLEDAKKQATDAAAKASATLKCAGFSADGAFVVLGAADGRVFHFDSAKGVDAGLVEAHAKAALAAAGGTSIAADGSVRVAALAPVWSLQTSIVPADATKAPVDRVTTLAFSPDGKRLASGGGVPSREGELAIWNVADGALLKAIPDAHSDTIYDLAFSPDGTRIASAAADKFAKIFDAASGKLVRSFEGHTYHVLGVSWSRNGRSLATAGGDSVVKVWNVATGQQTKTIQGFDKQVTSIRYLGYESQFAVSAGGTAPRVVKEDGGNVRNFEAGGATFFYALAASLDGRLVAAGGLDGVLRLWRAEANGLAASFAP